MKIGIKFILILETLVILSILIIGFAAGLIGTQTINERTTDQLESITILKKERLVSYKNERMEDMNTLSSYINDREPDNLKYFLDKQLTIYSNFFEFFIMDLDGRVTISTDTNQVGILKTKEKYFTEGLENITFQGYYYDQSLQQVAFTVSTPLEKNGTNIGVIAGRIKLEDISNIMIERSGLGDTGETYLVNNYNYVLSELRKDNTSSFQKALYTDIVKKCLDEKSNQTKFLIGYDNYVYEESIGAYTYLSDLQVCIISEITKIGRAHV